MTKIGSANYADFCSDCPIAVLDALLACKIKCIVSYIFTVNQEIFDSNKISRLTASHKNLAHESNEIY